MKLKSNIVLAFLLAVAAIAPACKKDQSATGVEAKQAVGLYAKGFNALLADPKRLIAGYFSSIPADKGPDFTRHPSLSSSSFALSKVKEAREAFAAAHDAAPESLAKLAPVANAALAATDKAIGIYEIAYKYYEAETYKDDKGAKAKQLHEQMIAANKEMSDAIGKLSDGMDAIEDSQVADDLAKYADDKDYSYWFRFYNQQAKQLIVVVTRASTPAEVAKLPAAAKSLAEIDGQLAAFVTAKGSKISSTFRNYADHATTFQAATTKLMRLAGAGKTFDDQEVSQAADAMIAAYNGLITMGNALYQVEAVNNLKDE